MNTGNQTSNTGLVIQRPPERPRIQRQQQLREEDLYDVESPVSLLQMNDFAHSKNFGSNPERGGRGRRKRSRRRKKKRRRKSTKKRRKRRRKSTKKRRRRRR